MKAELSLAAFPGSRTGAFERLPQSQKDTVGAVSCAGYQARSHDRIPRVARTTAELAGAEQIGPEHIAVASRYGNYVFFEEVITVL